MDDEPRATRSSFDWRWPAIISIVVVILLGIQMLRVNKSDEAPVATTVPVVYATPGPILSGEHTIAAGDFLATRFALNRRAKLSGEFQTGSVKKKVGIVVVDEQNFENWKQQIEFAARAQTGHVPGGKINPTLEPGTYFLIIDNRVSEDPKTVRVDFSLE